jgi:tetratricopeptide (TPR) repeat protein
MADIFVSYTSSDRDWAFWIGYELEALGNVPHIHDWEIPGGGDIMAWMEERHDAADRVLCIVSKAYLKKPYSSLERRAAQWAALTDRPNFLLPIFIEPCKTPTLFATVKRCDLYHLAEDEARARIKTFLTPPIRPPRGPFPGGSKAPTPSASTKAPPPFPSKAALSNIPIGVPLHFMGRDDALAAMERAFQLHEGRVAITALHGLRGVGKTTLAAAYAERHRNDYRAAWWIRAQTEAGLRADLVALGIRLGWVGADDREVPAVEAVMERLRHEGEGVLLIFDNAVDAKALKPYLPRGGGARVLVTSNAHAWRGVAVPVEIQEWPKEIGADYLIARTGREAERSEAEALSQALGGLPLAHEQAGAYCERLHVSFIDYRKRFKAAPVRLLDDARHAPAEYHDGLTVAKTFALAIEKAAKLHPAAGPLIVHAALLAPEPIPLFLFAEAREKLGEPLVSALAGEGLDEAVAVLRAFALVDRETIVDERDPAISIDIIRLHRLVRDVAAARQKVDRSPSLVGALLNRFGSGQRESYAREQLRCTFAGVLASVYPDDSHKNPASWLRCGTLTPHLLSICETEMADGAANAQCAELLNRAGIYFHGRGAYSRARPLFERALAIYEKSHGSKHPQTAKILNNLASVLDEQGELAAARPLFERALAIREKELGPEHSHTAMSLNDLALVLQARGELAKARRLLERARKINEKALGPQHPDTAAILINLARVLEAQGERAAARPLYERALAIYEKARGPEHPDTARSLSHLAFMFRTEGDLGRARPLYERALAITEKVLGPEHPDTATSLNNLARLLQAQGELAAARPLYKRALALYEKTLGPTHPNTNSVRSALLRARHRRG